MKEGNVGNSEKKTVGFNKEGTNGVDSSNNGNNANISTDISPDKN